MTAPSKKGIDKTAIFTWDDTNKQWIALDNAVLETIANGLSGASSDGTVALAVAETWYAVPSAAPASNYCLVVSKENSAGTIRWSFDNGGVPSATNGNKMTSDDIVFELGASQVVYFGSSTAGDDVNWVAKII